MTMIDDGEIGKAIEHVLHHLEEVPEDPELLFCLAVAHAQKEDLNAAVDAARRALNAGLPAGRFLAGPRELLAPLMETHAARELIYARHDADYIHGPLLGVVTETAAQVWVRTVSEASVQVVAEPEGGGAKVHESDIARSHADRDYTAVARLKGLTPNTSYIHRLLVNGQEQPDTWSFRTFPEEDEPTAFDIGFGACAGYTPWRERMWRRLASQNFPAFLLRGDNVYIDRPKHPSLQRHFYYRRQSRPEFRTFTGETWLPDSLTNPLLKHEKAVALDGPNVDVVTGQSPNLAFQTADEQQPSHPT